MIQLRWKEVSALQSQPSTDTKWIRPVSGIRSKVQDHCHPVGEGMHSGARHLPLSGRGPLRTTPVNHPDSVARVSRETPSP